LFFLVVRGMASVMESRRARGGGLLALGGALAVEGAMAKFAWVVAVLIILGSLVATAAIARGDHPQGLASVPLVASSALAWGSGTLLAFAASLHAFRRDRDHGIRALVSARARSDGEYLAARTIGLARAVAAMTAGGTLLIGLIAALVSRDRHLAAHTVEATVAGIVYSVAFAALLAPVGLATLAARSRVGGYFTLLVVLLLPEMLKGPMTRLLPEGWGEIASIPGALAALRASLLPTEFDPLRFLRAFSLLLMTMLLALLVVRGQLARFDRENPA
jgi:hypothetical protein